jgi:hypothetical protein
MAHQWQADPSQVSVAVLGRHLQHDMTCANMHVVSFKPDTNYNNGTPVAGRPQPGRHCKSLPL